MKLDNKGANMAYKIVDWAVMGLVVGLTGTFGYTLANWILGKF